MTLVDYSDSEEEQPPPPAKRVKTASPTDGNVVTLPPLPAAFRDLYSSTVRASTQDDPSLHAGRKRVIPHVVGNWPAHVYLECKDRWFLFIEEYDLLSSLIEDAQNESPNVGDHNDAATTSEAEVQTLLKNELGVPLPLHVSLSRPLTLKTDQKDSFLQRLRMTLNNIYIGAFTVTPLDLVWHPNEDRTRWFLVLRLSRPQGDGLRRLLGICNQIAEENGQPLLYRKDAAVENTADLQATEVSHDVFHISIAWSLSPSGAARTETGGPAKQAVRADLQSALAGLRISCSEVKIRIGQDVSSVPLHTSRTRQAE